MSAKGPQNLKALHNFSKALEQFETWHTWTQSSDSRIKVRETINFIIPLTGTAICMLSNWILIKLTNVLVLSHNKEEENASCIHTLHSSQQALETNFFQSKIFTSKIPKGRPRLKLVLRLKTKWGYNNFTFNLTIIPLLVPQKLLCMIPWILLPLVDSQAKQTVHFPAHFHRAPHKCPH